MHLHRFIHFWAFWVIWLTAILSASAQEITREDRSQLNQAIKSFNDEVYLPARKILEKLATKYPNDFEVNYYLGACYLNTRYQKTEAIPYLIKAVELGEDLIPDIAHKDLGDLFHMSYDFKEAIHHYNQYLKLSPKDDEYHDQVLRMIEVCNFAKELIKDTVNLEILNLGKTINSGNSEFAPYISADDSILFFSRTKFYNDEELLNTENPDTISRLFVSYRQKNQWSVPQQVNLNGIDTTQPVSLAGMSPDGQFIYVNAINNGQQDIYVARYLDNLTLNLEPLPAPINSEYWEGKVTISPDGGTLIFASDRPGGLGGKDLYRIEQSLEGNWNEPVNLGEPVNTIYDEDAPFMHPGGSILYFSSKGHNTMGGYDIYSYLMNKKNILLPENLGFPINTTGDDNYFILTANGKTGYFSSSFGNIYGVHDLYQVGMNMNIPLTLVKGTITAGQSMKPVPAKIRVFDNHTGKKIRYAYNPNPLTGNFLMIFPPGKNYDLFIEAEGYSAKRVNIYIPNQTEFYELYQRIHLSVMISLGEKVGEKLEVENVFFNTNNESDKRKDYSELFNLIEEVIETTDSLDQKVIESRGIEDINHVDEVNETLYENLFNLVDDAFAEADTQKLNLIHHNTIIPDRFNQVFFFSQDSNTSFFEKTIIDDDTIFTTPTLWAYGNRPKEQVFHNDLLNITTRVTDTATTFREYEKPKTIEVTPLMLLESTPETRKIITSFTVYFDLNKTHPNDDITPILDEIAALLVNNKNLGLIITGYTDTEGTPESNKILSSERALNTLKALSDMGFNKNRALIFANGEDNITFELNEAERGKNRRVELQVFELIVDKLNE